MKSCTRLGLLLSLISLTWLPTAPIARAARAKGVQDAVLEHFNIGTGALTGTTLQAQGGFGSRVSRLGDLAGGGSVEMIVGAMLDDTAGTDRSAIYIASIDPAGKTVAHSKIAVALNDPNGALATMVVSSLGFGVAWLESGGGLDYSRLAIGAPNYKSNDRAVWLVRLGADGQVVTTERLEDNENRVEDPGHRVGFKIGSLRGIHENGIAETVGARLCSRGRCAREVPPLVS